MRERAGLLLLGLVCLLYLAQALWLAPFRLTAGYACSAVEPQPVAGALRVARGAALYQDYRRTACVLPLTYGALEYALPGLAARLGALGEPLAVLRVGRGVSLLATLGCALVLGWLARRRGVPARMAWAAAVPLLWLPYVFEWTTKFTPDLPALCLSLAGWAVLGAPAEQASEARKITPARLALGLLLWTAGFHFKPTLLAGPIGFAGERLWGMSGSGLSRGWRKFALPSVLLVGGLYALLALASSAALAGWTGGLWQLNLVDSMRVCSLSGLNAWEALRRLEPAGLAVLGLMTLAALLTACRGALPRAYLMSLALALIFMMKQGSSVNYLLDPLALWGVGLTVWAFAPRSAERLDDKGQARLRQGFLAALALALLWNFSNTQVISREMRLPAPEELSRFDQARSGVPSGRVLCLDAYYGLSRRLPIPFADSYHAGLLARRGVVSFATLAGKIRARQFDVIIWNRFQYGQVAYHGQALYPEELDAALRAAYKPVLGGNWLVLWRPEAGETR